jgi:hypothetical protein
MPMSTTWRGTLTVGAAVAFVSVATRAGAEDAKPASAEPKPFSVGARPAWFLMGGLEGGGTLVANDRGGLLGGELSVVRLRQGKFFGFYGDGAYDFGAAKTYTTAGLELGYKFVGLDAGGAARIGGSGVEFGPTGRLFLTLGIVSVYGRYAYFVDARHANDANVVQVGALLKLPIAAWGITE